MTPDEINKELEELEGRLERLRVKYEQYFTGIEKAVPWVQRKDVDRRFQLLHREQMRSSGQRFRFNTLVQRFTTYQTYWGRILRRIEEGTLKRDVLRAQRLGGGVRRKVDPDLAPPQGAPPPEEHDDTRHAGRGAVDEIPAGMFDEAESPRDDGFLDFGFGAAPAAPVAPAAPEPPKPARPAIPLPSVIPPPGEAAARPRPMISAFAGVRAGAPAPRVAPPAAPGARPAGVVPPPQPPAPQAPRAASPSGDDEVRALYDRYVAARRQTGESGDVRFESVAKQVRETLPRLAEKYQGADVKLDVTIKDGKAILRPVVTVKKQP